MRWTCPSCEREFDRPRQAHVCVPGCTADETFARHPEQRKIYDAIAMHLRALGELHEDAVRIGVFLKSQRKLAEIRPMARALSLNLVLPRRVLDRRVTRHLPLAEGRYVHVIRLRDVSEVDAEVRGWLTEAYVASQE